MAKTLFRLLVFIGFSGLLSAQNSLGYQLRKGDVFTVEQKAEQHIIQNLDETSHELTNRVSAVLQFNVVQESDTAYILEFIFNDLIFKIESSLQGVLLDVHAAEPTPGDSQAEIFNSLLNIPVLMTLSKQGEIVEVAGGDQLVSKVLKQSGIPEGFSKTVMKKSLEQQYGSKALAESYEQMTYFYPKRMVREGEQWSNTYQGKLEAINTWTLDSLNTESAYISGKAKIAIKTDEPANSMRLEGEQQTTVTTDISNGFMREMRVQTRAEGISTAAQMGDVQIPTVVNSNVSYRLIAQKHVQ